MMFNNSKDKIREEREFFGRDAEAFRIAEVAELSGGRPIVNFYGETKNSQKSYKFLSVYTPAVGDKVIMARTGGTYVILGKVV